MVYSSLSDGMRIVALTGLALLAGCGGNVKQASKAAPVEVVEPSGEPGAPFVAIPDPYLAQDKIPPAAAQKAFSATQQVMQQKNWHGAHQALVKLTDAYPALSGPWVNLGIVEWRLGNLEAAENAFTKAIDINSLNNDAYNQAAMLLREQGKFPEAEARYLSALKVWPHSFESNRNLGILYDLYMGKFDLAMKHYELASKLASEPDREIQGWIIDLKRRLKQ